MRFFTGLIRPRAPVLGNEFAGVVEAVGGGVTSFEVGDKVFGYNEGRFGAHAEYMSIPADGSLATMPANVTYQEAAPSTEGYFRMLTARATISATVTMEMTDCRVMASLAQRDSGITSVGLNAEALVNAR